MRRKPWVVDQQDIFTSRHDEPPRAQVDVATGLITTVAGNGDSGYETRNGGCAPHASWQKNRQGR